MSEPERHGWRAPLKEWVVEASTQGQLREPGSLFCSERGDSPLLSSFSVSSLSYAQETTSLIRPGQLQTNQLPTPAITWL